MRDSPRSERAPEGRPASPDSQNDLRLRLAQASNLTPAELLDLLQADQLGRWRRGDRVPVEAYLQLCPTLQSNGDGALDLVVGEFLLRKELGESPTLAEYEWRFPQWTAQLVMHFELDEALAADLGIGSLTKETPSPLTHSQPDTVRVAPHRSTLPEVAGYELQEELGRGGMGVVYLARQLGLNRPAARTVGHEPVTAADSARHSLTQTGAILGTPSYMAPE